MDNINRKPVDLNKLLDIFIFLFLLLSLGWVIDSTFNGENNYNDLQALRAEKIKRLADVAALDAEVARRNERLRDLKNGNQEIEHIQRQELGKVGENEIYYIYPDAE